MKIKELTLRVKYRKEQFANLELIDASKVILAMSVFVVFAAIGLRFSWLMLVLMLIGLVYSEIQKTFKALAAMLLVIYIIYIPFIIISGVEMDALLTFLIVVPIFTVLILGLPYFLLNSAAKKLRIQK